MWEFREGCTLKNFYHAGVAGDYNGWLSSCCILLYWQNYVIGLYLFCSWYFGMHTRRGLWYGSQFFGSCNMVGHYFSINYTAYIVNKASTTILFAIHVASMNFFEWSFLAPISNTWQMSTSCMFELKACNMINNKFLLFKLLHYNPDKWSDRIMSNGMLHFI